MSNPSVAIEPREMTPKELVRATYNAIGGAFVCTDCHPGNWRSADRDAARWRELEAELLRRLG